MAQRRILFSSVRLAARTVTLAVALSATSRGATSDPERTVAARTTVMPRLPLYFEVNRGQADTKVQFLARGNACQFFVSPTEAVLLLNKSDSESPVSGDKTILAHLPGRASRATRRSSAGPVSSSALRMRFIGANPHARVAGEGVLPGKVNYFIGNDPAQWHTGVSIFTRVRVEGIYPDVDLVYYGNEQRLEYDFVVAPHADPTAIAVHFEGPKGIRVDANGDLVLSLGQDEIRQPRPTIYQEDRGVRKEISGGYQLMDRWTVTFKIDDYDRALPLIIDPVLSYSTYFGGSDSDTAWGVAVDTNGFVYVAGETMSAQLATTPGAFQTNHAGNNVFGDAFVAKFDNTASSLVYLTYLGGHADDFALAMTLDGAGNVYLTGYTDSTNFPLRSAIYTNLSGTNYPETTIAPTDAFVAKLDASGSNLVYSTYLGGNGIDLGIGIAVDPAGNACVVGYTESTNFPIVSGLYTNYGGLGDAFAARINPAGTALVYSTYLGGTNQDSAYDVATDLAGNAYVVGYTGSTNFPLANAVQSQLNNSTNISTASDAFITKLTPTGGALVYSTFLGGTNNDRAFGLALDSDANVYVTGSSLSGDFPTTATNLASAVISSNSTLPDVFVTKLGAVGTNWVYSVLFGGDGGDEGWAVAVDPARNAHIIGNTASLNFPTNNTSGFLRGVNSGGTDVFVAELDSNGTALLHSAYLGGAGEDFGYGINLDGAGNTYVAGETTSGDFPAFFAYQSTFKGSKDAFLAKIVPEPTLTAAQSNGNVILAWRAFAPEFQVQSNLSVTNQAGWRRVFATPVLTNGWHTVTLAATNNALFFRLFLP